MRRTDWKLLGGLFGALWLGVAVGLTVGLGLGYQRGLNHNLTQSAPNATTCSPHADSTAMRTCPDTLAPRR